MASITITNFYAKIPKDNITTTIAKLEYGCSVSKSYSSNYSVDNRKNGIGEYIDYTYYHGNTNYNWEFNLGTTKNISTSQSDSYTYTVISGTSYAFSAKLTVSFSVSKYKQVTIYKYVDKIGQDGKPIPEVDADGNPKVDANGDPIYEQEIKGFPQDEEWDSSWSESDTEDISYNIYTPPTAFTDYNFSSGTTIQSKEGLSASKVSNWCTHAGKYLSWRDQDNKYGTVNCNVSSGDLITAEWYNKCADIVDSSLRVNPGDLITADAFIKLGAAISP